MTNKNTRQILYEKSAGYRPDALGAFHSEKLQGKCKLCELLWNLVNQSSDRNQARDHAQFPHPAQAVHTPKAYGRAASPVLPAVLGLRMRWM